MPTLPSTLKSCKSQSGGLYPKDLVRGSQARITCEPLVVNSQCYRVHNNLDFLKVSLWLQWESLEFLSMLESEKQALQESEDESAPITSPDKVFSWNLSRTGTRFYNYRLSSGDIKLLLNTRKAGGQVPTARIEIGSLSSQLQCRSNYQAIVGWLKLNGATVVKEVVSEVHLAADFIGLDIGTLELENQDRWIHRPNKFTPRYYYRKLSGVSIGEGGDIMLRIYDKVGELKRCDHKQEVFKEIWNVPAYNQSPVTRVEYQLRRPALREFQSELGEIHTVEELFSALNSLWKYCTTDWSKFMDSVVDRRNHNQSKARYAPFWKAVRAVNWSGGQEFQRTVRTKHKNIDAMRKQARGLLMSICAFFDMHPDDIDTVMEVCHAVVETDMREHFNDKVEFIKQMRRKQNEVFQTFDIAEIPF